MEDLIKQRTQVVADTIKEKQGLEAQKANLEQKAAAAAKSPTDSSSSSPSSEQ